jgi:hypothetical protein
MSKRLMVERKKVHVAEPIPSPLEVRAERVVPAQTVAEEAVAPTALTETPADAVSEQISRESETPAGHTIATIPILRAALPQAPPAPPPLDGSPPDGPQTPPGQPIFPSPRTDFERSLNTDLSGVRLHADATSAAAAAAVHARAFTLGRDIYFASGEYDADSRAGRALLAHEVAHVAQHARAGTGTVSDRLTVSSPGDPLEVEADRAVGPMLAGIAASVTPGAAIGRMVMRDPVKDAVDKKKKDLEGDSDVEKKAAQQKAAPVANAEIDTSDKAAQQAAAAALDRQVVIKTNIGPHTKLEDKGQVEDVIREIRGQTKLFGSYLEQRKLEDKEAPGGDDQFKRNKSGGIVGIKTPEQMAPLYTAAAEKKAQNEKAELELRTYSDQISQQETTGDLFIMTYNALKVTAAAFDGRFKEFIKAHPKLGLSENEDLSGKAKAGAVIKSDSASVGQGAAAVKSAFDKPELAAQKETIRQLMLDLQEMPGQIPQKIAPISNSVQEVQTAALNVSAGTVVRGATPEEVAAEKEVKAIEGELAQTVSDIGAIMSTVQLAGGALGAIGAGVSSMGAVGAAVSGAFDDAKAGSANDVAMKGLTGDPVTGTDFGVNPKGAGLGKAAAGLPDQVGTATGGASLDIKGDIAKYLMSYDRRIAKANGGLAALKDSSAKLSLKVQVDQLTNAKARLQTALNDFIALCEAMNTKRKRLQDAISAMMKTMGPSRPGQPNMAMVLQFQVEAHSLGVAADTALKTGAEQKAKAETAGKQRAATVGSEANPYGKPMDKTEGGMTWWKVVSLNNKEFDSRDCILTVEEQTVSVWGKDKNKVTPNGEDVTLSIVGRQELIDKQMEEVTEIKKNADAMKERLATLTGI